MYHFNVSDRVIAAFAEGEREVVLVEGFITGIEQEGRLVAVRPASPEELDCGEMIPVEVDGSIVAYGDQVFSADDAEDVFEMFLREADDRSV